MDTDSFLRYIKLENNYAHPKKDSKTRFDALHYEVHRKFPKE